MNDPNPYSAPDATLNTGQEQLYQPSVFSLSGRIGRLRYLAYAYGISFLLMFIAAFITAMFTYSAYSAGESAENATGIAGIALSGLIYLIVLILGIVFTRRRLNDLNRSGWWFLLFIIPIVNLGLTIYLLFFPGSDGVNDFGPAPAENSLGVVITAWIIPLFFIVGIGAAILIPMYAGYTSPG